MQFLPQIVCEELGGLERSNLTTSVGFAAKTHKLLSVKEKLISIVLCINY